MASITAFPLAFQPDGSAASCGYRPLRCVGEPLLPTRLACDVARLLDVDPEVDRWLCHGAAPSDGGPSAVVIEVHRGAERERLRPVEDPPPGSVPAAAVPGVPSRAISRADLDPVRLENARLILPYARWRVTLDDRVRLLAALDDEGSVTLADCLGLLRHTARPVAAVASLALARVVDLDLDEPLGSRTRVIRRPD
ncbi:hypothetical protein [Aureimonas ureilytica]|uniref:hypothetical protein n=1 Tax=Aureimonas ureilytica TaxID=401562 RepID=UPI0003700BF9|nr:hypothetical protein [Aureimonas ureilytica]